MRYLNIHHACIVAYIAAWLHAYIYAYYSVKPLDLLGEVANWSGNSQQCQFLGIISSVIKLQEICYYNM